MLSDWISWSTPISHGATYVKIQNAKNMHYYGFYNINIDNMCKKISESTTIYDDMFIREGLEWFRVEKCYSSWKMLTKPSYM